MFIASVLRYTGFEVVLINTDRLIKLWTPDSGEQRKNLFCTYIYRGDIAEYTDEKCVSGFSGETFVNWDVTTPYQTKETYIDVSWLCFSSYIPLTATFLRVTEPTVIPAGVGVYNILGSFQAEDKTACPLNYLRPRNHDVEIIGDAKVILIRKGNFVNKVII